ncbi:zinc finger, CCHC-type containing protein [Tanacetum coccineum]
MGDENPIRTLGDYSRPSHEGYRNTIELPDGNNVVPLNWLERLPARSISTWEDLTTRFLSQCFPPRRTVKLRNDILMFQQHQEKSWATIEVLARYEDEGWNDPIFSEEGSLNYKNPDIEQLLGSMKNYVNTLMKDAISIIGRNENVFGKDYEIKAFQCDHGALGWHLEEIHLTWAHLEKIQTILRLYTIYLEELCLQSVETASQTSSDDVRIFKVTTSWIWRRLQDVADLKWL